MVKVFFDDDNQLLSALREIDNALELSKQNLLKKEELDQIELRSKERIEKNLDKDSLSFRKYEKYKNTTHWKDAYPRNYVGFDYVNKILGELRDIISSTLEEENGDEKAIEQVFIDKGKPFEGRKLIRDILVQAKNTIEIQDNYPAVEGDDQSILEIIEPYLRSKPLLKIRILAQKIDGSFLSDFKLLQQQYPERAEIRQHNNSHGRFLIIDESEVFAFGSSLKDLGKRADFVTKITDKTASEKAIREFNSWFKDSTTPSGKAKRTPIIEFNINEAKYFSWARIGIGFNMVWGFGLTLRINNFRNNKPDYVKVKLRANTNEGLWESQHFIFEGTKEKIDKPDEPFEIAPNKIIEIGLAVSQDYPEHSPMNNEKVPMPDIDRDKVFLLISTEGGVEQEIKIKPSLIREL